MTIKTSELSGQAAWDAVRRERDALAAQVETLRYALDAMVRSAAQRNCGLSIADEALALPDLHTDILRQRDARTLREMAERLCDFYATGGEATHAVRIIHKTAHALEKSND